jgi:hypothetical protein
MNNLARTQYYRPWFVFRCRSLLKVVSHLIFSIGNTYVVFHQSHSLLIFVVSALEMFPHHLAHRNLSDFSQLRPKVCFLYSVFYLD